MVKRTELIEMIRKAIGDRPSVFAAITTTERFDDVACLLLARPPKRPAVLAPCDGVLQCTGNTVTIESQWGPYEVDVDRTRLVVSDGARVAAAQPLTAGDVALADVIATLGAGPTCERIAHELGRLLDIDAETAAVVAAPMTSLIAAYTDETPLDMLLSRDCWEKAMNAFGDTPPNVRGREVVVGYDVLVTHEDPPADVFVARNARAAEAADRHQQLLADLEGRANAGDVAALQQLIVACLDESARPDPPALDAAMRKCRDARPGAFTLERDNDGAWSLGCGRNHQHAYEDTTVAEVVGGRPVLAQFLALRPGTRVTFGDWLHVTHPTVEMLPPGGSYWYRRADHAREGALSLDDATTAKLRAFPEAEAIGLVAELLLCPSWRAKELVVALRPPKPMFEATSELDHELRELHAAKGIIAAIVRLREASDMGLAAAKAYIEKLVQTPHH